jgi:uncharacterized protein (DUF433 family)
MKLDLMKANKSLDHRIIPGSKVSISVLIDYIKDGYSLAEFLSDYPWIKKSSAEKALDELKEKNFPVKYAF